MNYVFWIAVVVILGASIAIGLSLGLKKCKCICSIPETSQVSKSSAPILLKASIDTDFMNCQSIEERPNKGNFTLKPLFRNRI